MVTETSYHLIRIYIFNNIDVLAFFDLLFLEVFLFLFLGDGYTFEFWICRKLLKILLMKRIRKKRSFPELFDDWKVCIMFLLTLFSSLIILFYIFDSRKKFTIDHIDALISSCSLSYSCPLQFPFFYLAFGVFLCSESFLLDLKFGKHVTTSVSVFGSKINKKEN